MPKLNYPWLTVDGALRKFREIEKKSGCIPGAVKSEDYAHYPELQDLISKMKGNQPLDEVKDWVPQLNVKSQWLRLNTEYGYFTDSALALDLYQQLLRAVYGYTKLCEPGMVRDESTYHDYAYKLMALYVDEPISKHAMDEVAAHFDKLSKSFPSGSKTPLHSSLALHLSSLPVANLLKDEHHPENKSCWQKLIRAHGILGLDYFNRALEIQKSNLNRAPQSLKEAEAICNKIRYSRYEEDATFANLCGKYDISEQTFNAALDYMQTGWPKKVRDDVPDVMVERGRFSWFKLSPEDKRALVLGKITDCCQSIDSTSAQCVKDAVSLPSNGLYILKDKEKLIGQAYVWLSDTGNLCLDSIECLSESIKDDELKEILKQFAEQVLRSYPQIKRVTLGQGGNTPKDLFPQAPISEMMREGYFYGDAADQYVIARRSQRDILRDAVWQENYSEDFLQSIDYLSDYIVNTSHWPEELSVLIEKNPNLPDVIILDRVRQLVQCLDEPIDLSYLLVLGFDLNDLPGCIEILSNLPERYLLMAIKEKNLASQTVLHAAASDPQSLKTILELLPKKYLLMALKEKDADGWTVFHTVVSYPDSLKLILELLPEEILSMAIKQKNAGGLSVFHVAAAYPESLKMLLELYSDDARLEIVNKKDAHGWTVLRTAANYPDSLKMLLELLPEHVRLEAVKEERDGNGCSILHVVAQHPESLKMVLELYPKDERLDAVKKESNENGWTVVHAAANHPECLKTILALLPFDARLEAVKKKDNGSGWTVLHVAAGNIECLKIVLTLLPFDKRLGAIKEKNNRYCQTVLHAAVSFPECLKMLLELYPEEARLDALREKNKYGEKLLDVAANYPESLKTIFDLLSFETILELFESDIDQDMLPILRESILQKCSQDSSLLKMSKKPCSSHAELKNVLVSCIKEKSYKQYEVIRDKMKRFRPTTEDLPEVDDLSNKQSF